MVNNTEVVSRNRDPQLQMGENYPYLSNKHCLPLGLSIKLSGQIDFGNKPFLKFNKIIFLYH